MLEAMPLRRWRMLSSSVVSTLTLVVASGVGIAAFVYPFLLSNAPAAETQAHAGDAPLMFGLLAGLASILFLVELSSGGINAKVASALAVLTVAAAALRVPVLPAGGNAFFLLIMLGGYVFGPRFGFLLGALALFASSFLSGGIGPWVPYQMFGSAWVGLTAGWLGLLRPQLRRAPWIELGVLVVFGVAWGFLFGAIMNLWFWPYVASGESLSWEPGLGIVETGRRYWSFYVLTSAGWDVWRGIVNVVLIALAGRPLIDVLVRYRERFTVEVIS